MVKAKMCGIYCIRNGDKFYVGQSIDIVRRFKEHQADLKNGKHRNVRLTNSYNLHGIEAFSFEIIEIVNLAGLSVDDGIFVLDELEQKWMDILNSYNSGYNCTPKSGGSCLGVKHTPEFCAAITARQLGKSLSPEHLAKLTKFVQSEEHRAATSKRHKGKVTPEATKLKMSLAAKGVPKSKEATAKSVASRLGMKQSAESIEHQKSVVNGLRHNRNGYYKAKDCNRYYAAIMVDRKKINLGGFATAEEAHQAYLDAIALYFPELSS